MPKTDVDAMVSYLYVWTILRQLLKGHSHANDALFALDVLMKQHATRWEYKAVLTRFHRVTDQDTREYWHRIAVILSDELRVIVIDHMAKSMMDVMQ